MTSVPVTSTEVDLSTTRAGARTPAPARPGALEPVPGSAVGVRFGRTAVSTAATTAEKVAATLDVWSDDRPSLRKLYWYTLYGQWTGEWTPMRVAGVIDAVLFTLPITAAGYLLLWVVERPSRRVVAALILGLACLTGIIGVPLI